jgi:hypothetical protein
MVLAGAFGLLAATIVFISDDFGSRCGLTSVMDGTRVAFVGGFALLAGAGARLVRGWSWSNAVSTLVLTLVLSAVAVMVGEFLYAATHGCFS